MLGLFFRQIFRSRPAPAPPASASIAEAIALQQAGEHDNAVAMCRTLLERTPDDANVLHLLGSNLLALDCHAEAVQALSRTTELDAGSAEAHYNFALAQRGAGDASGALTSFRRALDLKPARVEAALGAAHILYDRGELDEAAALYTLAVERRPDFAEGQYSLGVTLATLQRYPEAIERHRKALAIEPGFALAHSNLLFLLNAHESAPQPVRDEHRAWARRHADTLGTVARYENTLDPARRLRIGYVSADLWHHPVGLFLKPLLEHHDRKSYEVVCFHSHPKSDAVTRRLKDAADQWIECVDWSDDALARRVRKERIDVLVDLGGHTSGGRLLAFARKPAPLQATYLGYPTTTGIAAIDYRITDRVVDPPGSEALNAETPLRLPHSYFCYAADDTQTVAALPARSHGHVTFGSFNACVKWSDETLALWARVLKAVPDSKLLLKAKDLSNARIRSRVLERLEALELPRERITLRGWAQRVDEHLSAYGSIDIALDTYPYNGATTTCEALWMGVPVVTLKGATHASRMAASVLAATGLEELVADSAEGYARIAADLAADLDKLTTLREGLRGRMRVSPLMDAAAFTRALESEYRRMWQAWCRGRTAPATSGSR